MKTRRGNRIIDGMVVLTVVGIGIWSWSQGAPRTSKPPAFAEKVDLRPLYETAVHADGRLRSFESHAKAFMGYVSGPRRIDGQSNGFTHLDMMFRPERYADKDIVYVKNKQVRAQIIDVAMGRQNREGLNDAPPPPAPAAQALIDGQRAAAFMTSGLVSRRILAEPSVRSLLQRLGQDLIRTAKVIDAIQSALTVSNPDFLTENLRVIAPPNGDSKMPWFSIAQALGGSGVPTDDIHSAVSDREGIPGLAPEFRDRLREHWSALRTAWRAEDAPKVTEHVEALAKLLPSASPNLYPTQRRLALESWYFHNNSMTWVWWLYAAAVVPLLMSVIYGWGRARTLGMAVFGVALLGHSASLAIRWYISGRWPNSNMFEAVHTSAWFGAAAALLLEVFTRKTPVRNLFALGASVVSMAALMAAYFLPAQLDSTINNKMAALNDVWLYIHTNMIILSYALIGLACVTALLTLRHRWCVAWDHDTVAKARLLILPVALGVANFTGYKLLMHVIDPVHYGLSRVYLTGMSGGFLGSMMILFFEMLEARARRAISPSMERAAAGGAASLILGMGPRHPFVRQEGPTAGQVFDGATMVLLELSFITLWTGIVMGAIWADHSWGRPWGWDPKEVFALNTFIIFLILVHVRLKVRDKGLWTAILAVAGFEVMMFNWIVVNFVISGLHSYA